MGMDIGMRMGMGMDIGMRMGMGIGNYRYRCRLLHLMCLASFCPCCNVKKQDEAHEPECSHE